MKEHKSNLKALEPVEIRLASAVRIRHEIARLSQVEQALESDAREIALSVVVRPEVVDVVLGVIGGAFADDMEAFDQTVVEAFLAEHHDLRIGAAAAAHPPSPADAPQGAAGARDGGAPSPSGTVVAPPPSAPAPGVPSQPSEGPAAQQHDAEPSAAEAVVARLSNYDVDMPADYLGVSFDMLKRPEADLIMGEAILAVIDGLPLDASPYKGDRGKVHWRRKLFEETFAFFLASPPRPKTPPQPPSAEADVVAPPQAEAPRVEPAPADARPLAGEADADAEAPEQPSAVLVPEGGQAETSPLAAAAVATVEARPETREPVHEQIPADQGGSWMGEADRGEGAMRPDADDGGGEGGEDLVGLPLIEPVREAAVSGQVIDFPSQTPATVPADLDVVDPFESSPPHRSTALLSTVPADDRIEDGAGATTPTYDGPDWEGPGGEGEDDLDRNFADRVGYDRDDDDRYGASEANPGLDHAAAAALAQAVEVPTTNGAEAARLPAGGVPPRPGIAMPSVRPVPAVPPRPAMTSPGPVGSSLPPARPALAGTGDGARLAPRPVAVRPPGM